MPIITFPLRDKAILAGLYLSKFDKEGLDLLGFNSFKEAYNIIGFALKCKPNSIKNYRDEFDPLFPNRRLGWENRDIRPYVKKIYDKYNELDLNTLAKTIKESIYRNSEIDILMEQIECNENNDSSFAKRLATGQAAEYYFEENYKKCELFKDSELENTTKYGCGFDFKLKKPNLDYIVVEVKGLSEMTGNIVMTNKEYSVSQIFGDRYFLFIVKNFKENPFYKIFQNPSKCDLKFQHSEYTVKQILWSTYV